MSLLCSDVTGPGKVRKSGAGYRTRGICRSSQIFRQSSELLDHLARQRVNVFAPALENVDTMVSVQKRPNRPRLQAVFLPWSEGSRQLFCRKLLKPQELAGHKCMQRLQGGSRSSAKRDSLRESANPPQLVRGFGDVDAPDITDVPHGGVHVDAFRQQQTGRHKPRSADPLSAVQHDIATGSQFGFKLY